MSDSVNQLADRVRHALEKAMLLTDNYPLGKPAELPTPAEVHTACAVALDDLAVLQFKAQEQDPTS